MNVSDINDALFQGEAGLPGVLPHLDQLAGVPFRFDVDFGLPALPEEPGILLVRGARQYGKSTWLEGQIRGTVEGHGPGSAYYLNGDEIRDSADLVSRIRALLPLYSTGARLRRLFIDEITAVPRWEEALKRLVDTGELRPLLVVTTGSRATDLRRGGERLPGRKGRLSRSTWLFTPISYGEFKRVCGPVVRPDDVLPMYLLSGGSPVALAELAARGRIEPYVIETVRDWVYGECAAAGRSRASLLAVMDCLHRFGASAVGQAKLSREAGLANNTVAAGYIELLADLLCVGISHAWDPSRRVRIRRQPAKYPFINLLFAIAWHPAMLRSPSDVRSLPEPAQGVLLEWLVAQELWRRAAIRGAESPELLLHWRSKQRELDFVEPPERYVEVKRGAASPLEYAWFPRAFPGARLEIVGASAFETVQIRGVPMESFLG